ncbi:glutaredoxin family protein [Aestuariibacter sp. GS-14]|uniref:glutaredoxin family protein n=1 Tax=Aestuariibacter sp. GS-14 TaxID=2590670 RepID=UPI00112692DD|nr:glutaredoxin family protein [Aestuariibacter sp. GS-14]TPV60004.1 glutaredoxin family protein [Aestuariibacter sp. GS-14]
MKLALFTGPQCCLCNDAKALVAQCSKASAIELTEFNIRENPAHYHLYAVRIPVLKREDSEAELGWPFTLQDLELFLQ